MIVGSWNHLLPIVDYKYMSIHMQRSPFCKALLFSMLGHIRAIRFQPCPQADIYNIGLETVSSSSFLHAFGILNTY